MGTKKEALNYRTQAQPSDASTPPPYSKKIKVKDIERDVEYTRTHMDDVIDELAERLHPRQLVHDFVDIITGFPQTPEARDASHAIRDSASRLGEKLRHDPLPFAVIGAGIAWLALSGRGHDGQREPREYEYGNQAPLSHAVEDPEMRGQMRGQYPSYEQNERPGMEGMSSKANESEEKVREKADEAGEKTLEKAREATEYLSRQKDKTGDYAGRASSHAAETIGKQVHRGRDQMSHMAGGIRDEAQSAGHATSRGYQKARQGITHTMERNPLAAGAVALGAGALIGLLMPHTEAEDHYLHDSSQRTRESMTQKARQFTEAGKRVATAAAAEAGREARREGVAPEQLAEQARSRSEGERATATSPDEQSPIEKAERIARKSTEAAKEQYGKEQRTDE